MDLKVGAVFLRGITAGETLCRQTNYAAMAFPMAFLALGCADNYQPLTESDIVSIRVSGFNSPILVKDGVSYRSHTEACIAKYDSIPELEWAGSMTCWVPRTAPRDYDPDTFVTNGDDFGSFELPCYPNGTAECGSFGPDADAGRVFQFTVNEYTESTITMPPAPVLTVPKSESQFRVSSGDDLAMAWKPISTSDVMIGFLFLSSRAPEPCIEFAGKLWATEIQDTGFVVVPKEDLPVGLPEAGCRFTIGIKTQREGSIDPGIPNGRIVGEQYSSIEITLLP